MKYKILKNTTTSITNTSRNMTLLNSSIPPISIPSYLSLESTKYSDDLSVYATPPFWIFHDSKKKKFKPFKFFQQHTNISGEALCTL